MHAASMLNVLKSVKEHAFAVAGSSLHKDAHLLLTVLHPHRQEHLLAQDMQACVISRFAGAYA